MTFYQELQLSSVGSKQLIHSTTDKKEKRHRIIFLFPYMLEWFEFKFHKIS